MVAAITWSDRDREGCDYTITELLRPPRIGALERIHKDELEEDASDRIWALLGSAGHEVLRRSAPGGIVEERAIVDLKVNGKDYKVGGRLDYGKTDLAIWDYKFTSVYAVKEGVKEEWEQQLNCYRYLAHCYGVQIEHLWIVAVLRDWSVREARRDPEYPQTQVKVFEVHPWGLDEAENFLKGRIALHEGARKELPECLDSETWAKPPVWAVKKKGNVRALKLHSSELAANNHAAQDPKGLVVEYRPGERPRCESYCSVSQWCEQWQTWLAANRPPAKS